MIKLPVDEPERLLELKELRILDKASTPGLEALIQLASEAFQVPIALTSIVDTDRQWFMACMGLGVSETPREFAFCHHALFSEDPLVIEDATNDARFSDNPLVLGEPHIRFYAGAPLVMPSGHILGTFCIIDSKPRSFTGNEVGRLKLFATAARDIIAGLAPAVGLPTKEETEENHFLAGLAHDLRSPIGNMMGFAELMQHEAHGPLGASAYGDYVKYIRQSGSHALQLIDSILSVERSKVRSMSGVERFNLTDLVHTIAKSFESKAAGRRQTITVDASNPAVECEADSLTIHRILNNLVSNACKYAGERASIAIELSDATPGRVFSVSVIDDGSGIPEAVLAKVGEPFVTEGGDSVSGLGLSNVLRLASAIGCICEIENRKPRGVRAAIYRPAKPT